jgi:protein-L-isoaspartate(D-aspartate) O-methyltransferase
VKGDGGLGYPEMSSYDKIAVTAACIEIPSPLIEQLSIEGRVIAPVLKDDTQELVFLEKGVKGIQRNVIVLYVLLRSEGIRSQHLTE